MHFYSHPNLLAVSQFSHAFITLRPHSAVLHMLQDFQGQIHGKIGGFCGNFADILGANFAKKTIVKKRLILWDFSSQISLEIDQFRPDCMFFNRDNH